MIYHTKVATKPLKGVYPTHLSSTPNKRVENEFLRIIRITPVAMLEFGFVVVGNWHG